LGLASGRQPEGDPDIVIELTPLMRQRLIEALTTMPAAPSELCWFCEASIELPIDRFGGVHGDRDITCSQCKATLRTAETEDDAENLVVTLAPVRCGHGIDHDEWCRKCSKPETAGRKQRT
ncbi:MAG: hypothetical protein ACREXY_15500, partial [Gammaproteobacteria bacterium]